MVNKKPSAKSPTYKKTLYEYSIPGNGRSSKKFSVKKTAVTKKITVSKASVKPSVATKSAIKQSPQALTPKMIFEKISYDAGFKKVEIFESGLFDISQITLRDGRIEWYVPSGYSKLSNDAQWDIADKVLNRIKGYKSRQKLILHPQTVLEMRRMGINMDGRYDPNGRPTDKLLRSYGILTPKMKKAENLIDLMITNADHATVNRPDKTVKNYDYDTMNDEMPIMALIKVANNPVRSTCVIYNSNNSPIWKGTCGALRKLIIDADELPPFSEMYLNW